MTRISLTVQSLGASEATLAHVHAALCRLGEAAKAAPVDAQPTALPELDSRPQVALWVVEAATVAQAGEALQNLRIWRPKAVQLVCACDVSGEDVEQWVRHGAFDFIRHPAGDEEMALRLHRARAWLSATLLVAPVVRVDIEMPPPEESFQAAKARVVEHFERSYIERLLRASDGNISRAARLAKKNRRAFFELIRKHEIDADQFRMTPA